MAYVILTGCPRCGSFVPRPSRLRGMWERLRRRLTRKHPFRCDACGWRGWANESWDRRQRTIAFPGSHPRRRKTDRGANDGSSGAAAG